MARCAKPIPAGAFHGARPLQFCGVQLSYCPYRLLFKRPFTTSHGTRDGTDAVFLRIEHAGVIGYGEATLPPYLKEHTGDVIVALQGLPSRIPADPGHALGTIDAWAQSLGPGARAMVQMALIDTLCHKQQTTIYQHYRIDIIKHTNSLMTLGVMPSSEVAHALSELSSSSALKVKVNGLGSQKQLKAIIKLSDKQIFIDANQGLRSIEEALALIELVGDERVLGMEQPFSADQIDQHAELRSKQRTKVYADESIQDLQDLERYHEAFDGVNLKLMKCGGLDRAVKMAERARSMGMSVMLGSMSESSLGCTAMAHLGGWAEVVDLDGPWLNKNDPFRGITMEQGRIVLPEGPGIGAELVVDLDWTRLP